jgi:hypothetical protein
VVFVCFTSASRHRHRRETVSRQVLSQSRAESDITPAANAEGSTLRLTLGCLLADELGIELRRVGSGKRFTFSTGEKRLSEWMEANARIPGG